MYNQSYVQYSSTPYVTRPHVEEQPRVTARTTQQQSALPPPPPAFTAPPQQNPPHQQPHGGNTVVQPAQPVPPVQLAQPVVQPQAVQDNMVDRLMEMMQDQFGLKPKEQAYMYRKPYPEAYDRIPMPARYKVPDFTKFSGQDNTSTVEHISRFLVQCGEAAVEDALKIRLFRLSLSGSVFAWFSSLPANSIVQ